MSHPLSKAILQALDTHYSENPARWSRGAWARDANGTTLIEEQIFDHNVRALCAEAGIRYFARKLVGNGQAAKFAAEATIAALQAQIGEGFDSIPSFNDNSSFGRVRAVIRQTVAAL
jgi:hypothetical protein